MSLRRRLKNALARRLKSLRRLLARLSKPQDAHVRPQSKMKGQTIHDKFRCLSNFIARWTGSVWAFATSILMVVVWAGVGPTFKYSDTWQLFINTSTTVLTFWMVFVIQNTQNRDAKVSQLKLDELIRSLKKARNSFVNLEELSDEEIRRVEKNIKDLSQRRTPLQRNRTRRRKKPCPLPPKLV